MGILITIIVIAAVIGGLMGLFGGENNKGEDAATGALAGAGLTLGCFIQLAIAAIPIAIGLWILGLIFG